MTTLLRLATADDVETLFDIRTSVTQNHLSREQLAEQGITADLLRGLAQRQSSIWLAEIDYVAAGFSMIDDTEGELFALFVRPEFEGRGVGRSLLRQAEKSLFGHFETIYLITDGGADIRANGFYQRHGWVQTERVDARDVRYEKQRGATH